MDERELTSVADLLMSQLGTILESGTFPGEPRSCSAPSTRGPMASPPSGSRSTPRTESRPADASIVCRRRDLLRAPSPLPD